MPAYANGRRTYWTAQDPDFAPADKHASWRYRSAVSIRAPAHFFGYKIDAAVDVATGLRTASDVCTGKHHEHKFTLPPVRRAKARGFQVKTASMDRGYDTEHIHGWCNELGVVPIIPLQRKATEWRCPTGECQPGRMWVKADRLRPSSRATLSYFPRKN